MTFDFVQLPYLAILVTTTNKKEFCINFIINSIIIIK